MSAVIADAPQTLPTPPAAGPDGDGRGRRTQTAGPVGERTSGGRHIASRVVLYALAVFGACLFMGPFLFTITSSLKTPAEIRAFPPTLFPAVPQWQNYIQIFQIPGIPY